MSRIDYVETELAKRRQNNLPTASTNLTSVSTPPRPGPATVPPRQPASLGKIHEIDLGPTLSQQNAERTEMAIRRARGEPVPPAPEPTVKRVKKVRLGRDGKPRRPRGPKPRSSEEVEREKAVEQILRENKRMYPIPPVTSPALWLSILLMEGFPY